MKSKLVILILALALAPVGYTWAHEGDQHQMPDGTMMDDDEMTPGQMDAMSAKAVEVGNKICPVSGEEVPAPGEKGEMGEAVKYEYNGKIYNLCCPMCVKDFKKDPEKYSKIAEDEVAQEK